MKSGLSNGLFGRMNNLPMFQCTNVAIDQCENEESCCRKIKELPRLFRVKGESK